MSDLHATMVKAIEAHIVQLAYVRSCRRELAAVAVAETYAANLRDSRETSMESYWREMVAIADGFTRGDG